MKYWMALTLAATLLGGCAQEEPIPQQASEKFQRGIRGEGTLYQRTNENDPFIRDEGAAGR